MRPTGPAPRMCTRTTGGSVSGTSRRAASTSSILTSRALCVGNVLLRRGPSLTRRSPGLSCARRSPPGVVYRRPATAACSRSPGLGAYLVPPRRQSNALNCRSPRIPGRYAPGNSGPRALAGLRIYVGLIFLPAVVPKLRGDFAPRLNGFLSHVGLVEGHPFYQTFLTTTVLPLGLVAWLVKAGELLAAFSLICGLATHLGALLALVLTLNYMFAKGAWPWQPSSNDA